MCEPVVIVKPPGLFRRTAGPKDLSANFFSGRVNGSMPRRKPAQKETAHADRHRDPRHPHRHLRPRRRAWLLLIPALAVLGIAGGATPRRRPSRPRRWTPARGAASARADSSGCSTRSNATAGQRGQIEAIWAGLRPQLKSLHQQHRAMHQQIAAALTAPTINPATVEQLRQQSMGVANQMSSTFTQGLVQTAQVLTPDQRTKRRPRHRLGARALPASPRR